MRSHLHATTWPLFDFATDGILTAVPAGPSTPSSLKLGGVVVGEYRDMRTGTDMITSYNPDGTVGGRKTGQVMVAAYEWEPNASKKQGLSTLIQIGKGLGLAPRYLETLNASFQLLGIGIGILSFVVKRQTNVVGISEYQKLTLWIYRTWAGNTVPPLEEGWRDIEGGEIKVLDHIQLGYRLWSTRACLSPWSPKIELTIRYKVRTEAGHNVDCSSPSTVPSNVTCRADKAVEVKYANGFALPPAVSILVRITSRGLLAGHKRALSRIPSDLLFIIRNSKTSLFRLDSRRLRDHLNGSIHIQRRRDPHRPNPGNHWGRGNRRNTCSLTGGGQLRDYCQVRCG